MPISVLNWAVAKTVLERDRPNADPADINRFSIMAALVPGVAGLMVPFIAQNSLPDDDDTTGDTITISGGTTTNTDGATTIVGGTTTATNGTTTNTGGTVTTTGGTTINAGGTVTTTGETDEIRQRLDSTDRKLADLDKKLDAETVAINQHLTTTDGKLDDLGKKLDAETATMNSKLDGLDKKLTELIATHGTP